MRIFLCAGLFLLVGACLPSVSPESDSTPTPSPDATPTPTESGEATIRVGAWNVRGLSSGSHDLDQVTEIIRSLDVTAMVIEEVADPAALETVAQKLGGFKSKSFADNFGGVEIAVLWKTNAFLDVQLESVFGSDSYNFPRPVVRADFQLPFADDFTLLGVHLKAGFDSDSVARRTAAVKKLKSYMDTLSDDDALVAGDFNCAPSDSSGVAVMQPFLDDTKSYEIQTWALTEADASFIPGDVVLDHVVTRAGLAEEVSGEARVVRVDDSIPAYTDQVTDHRPVVIDLHFSEP